MTAIIDIPDIRQINHWSCGAASSNAVGSYFGVGPKTLPEWEKVLETSEEKSTDPKAIVAFLKTLGLMAEPRQNMTIADLETAINSGSPVIVCVQDYSGVRSNKAKWAYGHYLTIIGRIPGYLVAQDSSIENAEHKPGGDVSESKADHDGNLAAPGRVLIRDEDFVAAWHDVGEDGTKYVNFGIVVSAPTIDGANRSETVKPVELWGRTVWIATGLGAHEKTDVFGDTALSGAFQHMHEARLIEPGAYRPDKLVGPQDLEKGVRAQLGQASDSDQAKPISYQFDSTLFSIDRSKEWLAKHSVTNYIFSPDERDKPPIRQGGAREEGEKAPAGFSDLASFYSRTTPITIAEASI